VRKAAIFIAVEVDDSITSDATLAAKLAEVCPVNIFAGRDGHVEIAAENLDECVLCRLCLDAVDSDPTHPVKVIKLYDGGAEL
jgi:ferredoxin-like protein FixX